MTKKNYQRRVQKTPHLNKTRNDELVVRHGQAARTAVIRAQQAQVQVIVIHQVTDDIEKSLAAVRNPETGETDFGRVLVLGLVNVGEQQG